ncbi:hypothetical protein Sste5346_009077 [Sporothrix stenoceras]|uniref:HMA domain-containing protein n=1 Tax=Sporothrix stenoceras TaxID=5173 RepID=A0ABR3YLA2_9PEZI
MARCYIAASMIAFILRSADALDIGLDIQYNDEVTHNYGGEYGEEVEIEMKSGKEAPTTPLLLVTVSGMTCGACVGTVEQAIKEVDGVDDVQVSLALQEARVFLSTTKYDDIQSKIVAAIEDAGYGAVHAGCDAPPPAIRLAMLQHTDELARLRATLTGLGQYGTAVFALGTGARLSGWMTSIAALERTRSLVLLGLTMAAVWTHARWILESAWKAAKAGRATMHTLITASTLVGLSLGAAQVLFGSTATGTHYDSILGVLLIVGLGRYMDLLSRKRATRSFAGLYTLLEQTSTVELAKSGGDANKTTKGRKIPAHLVRPGDEIVIHPYRLVPCDSYVVSGTSHTNEAIVTGEARPRPKGVGDRLLAGSKNGPGLLRAAVINNDDGGSFLAQLVSRVEGALASKPAAQKKVDGITQYFVSAVLIVAVVAATVDFYSVSHVGLSSALTAAAEKLMVVLAAACPCALGLAVPCAVMAGIDVAWQNGILMLQGAETMERAAATTHVVLDKTGTLTRGTPEVTDINTHDNSKKDTQTLATLVCAAEVDAMANHPLASAVFRHMLPLCGEESWRAFRSGGGQSSDIKKVPGRGVQCQVTIQETCRHVVVGSLTYLQETGVEALPTDPTATNEDDHGSRVFVGVDGRCAATLTLHDKPKTDALQTLAALRRRGLHAGAHHTRAPLYTAQINVHRSVQNPVK